MNKTCCLIGHSKIEKDISGLVEEAVERHIREYGVTDFLVGNYGAFDRIGAAALRIWGRGGPAGCPAPTKGRAWRADGDIGPYGKVQRFGDGVQRTG